MNRIVLVLGLVAGLATGAVADEKELWSTRMIEAARAQRWEDAALAWGQLREADSKPPTRLVFLAAQVELERKHVARATDLLHTLLSRSNDHLDALYLLARIEARRGNLDETRALLLRSARAGQAVLRDLQASDESSMAPLRRDPRFLLDLLRAGSGVQITGKLRDPFARPVAPSPGDTPPVVDPLKDKTLQELEAKLRQLLIKAKTLAEARNIEPLRATLDDVRSVFQRFEERAPGSAQRTLLRLRSELQGVEELFHSLQLQLWVTRGNHLLRLTAAAARDGDWDRALRSLSHISGVVAQLEAVDRAVFRNTARGLRLRAAALNRHVRIQRTIEGLELRVSGIVVPPKDSTEALPQAIVNDRIVLAGKGVPHDVLPVSVDVIVERIQASSVTFSYEGVSFVRTLEPKSKK